jgi:lysophospholipase L1-like esterase
MNITRTGLVKRVGRQLGRATGITLAAGALGGAALLAAEALAARARRYAQPDLTLAMRTSVGPATAPALRLVLLGDSSAVGVGVERVADTVGGRLAELLAAGPESEGRRIELSSVAVSGSRAEDLATQVARALVGERPDVAVILVGLNDAVRPRGARRSAAHLAAAVHRLRDADVNVVVGTCPDLGAVRAFAPPLRQLVGLIGRRVADAQTRAVRAAGGVPVDLARLAGPVFRADAGTLCHDGLHPSADGYRVWAHALYPAVAEAAGVTSR